MNKKTLLEKYFLNLNTLLKLAKENTKNEVEFCSLISARTGKCGEGCKYCSQSSYYSTNIPTHPLVDIKSVINSAKEAKENGATRFAIVTSGRGPSDEDIEIFCKMIKEINNLGLKSCASIGLLKDGQAEKLKEAGLVRFHHNINTCRSYHPYITDTHTYDDRLDTIKKVKNAGIELCCGVIIGMGETVEQRIEMALELREIAPQSIPFNILTPIKGTPFENYGDKIDEENILRTAAIFKIANPNSSVRFAGGRKARLSKENMELALKNCVEAVLIGNYLTTIGITPKEDRQTLEKLGKTLSV